jgi:hypothetical protein
MGASGSLLAIAISLVILLPWSAYELLPSQALKPGFTLALMMSVVVALIALSGKTRCRVGGCLGRWSV